MKISAKSVTSIEQGYAQNGRGLGAMTPIFPRLKGGSYEKKCVCMSVCLSLVKGQKSKVKRTHLSESSL